LSVMIDQTGDLCCVRFEGEVTLDCAAELQKLLLEAVSSRKALAVNLERAVRLDVSATQLLFAAQREAARAGRVISVSGTIPAEVEKTLRESGVDLFAPADATTGDRCE